MKVLRNIPERDWLDLIGRSHQTSLFVLPEWLKLYKDQLDIMAVQAANGELIAGLVTVLGSEPLPYVPYQGVLLTRREMPVPVNMLLEAAEQVHSPIYTVNSPAGLDIRPFKWRAHRSGALWTDSVLYTFFLDDKSRPFNDLDPSSEPVQVDSPTDEQIAQLGGVVERDDIERLLDLDSVQLYTNDAGELTLFGTDLQGRGYTIAATEHASGLVVKLAARCPAGTDLYGCNSESMNKRKRVYGARLRTYYRLDRVR